MCEECLCREAVHVHHLTYARKYNELLTDLKALCKKCHDDIHKARLVPKKSAQQIQYDEKKQREVYLRRAGVAGVREELERMYVEADAAKTDESRHWFLMAKIKEFTNRLF